MKKRKQIMSIALCTLVLISGLSVVSAASDDRDIEDSLENKGNELFVYHSFMNRDGTILYVGGTGPNNYTKIQDAIDNASDGDTVFVYDNLSPYYEHLVINVSLNLVGENKESTIIDGGERGNCVTINEDNVLITGFTIERDGWYDDGIILNANNSQVIENILDNCGKGVITYQTSGHTIVDNNFVGNYDGIRLSRSNDNNIFGNTIEGNYLSGIVLWSSTNNHITQNTITGKSGLVTSSSYNGVSLSESNNNIVTNNTITSIEDNIYGGINLVESSDNSLFDNELIKCGLKWSKSYDNNIDNNNVNGRPLVVLQDTSDRVVDNAGQVFLIRCRSITVKNSRISHTGSGIYLYQTHNSIIQDNTINHSRYGVNLQLSRNNQISSNDFDNCWWGVYTFFGLSNVISQNTITNSYYNGIFVSSIRTIIRGNIIKDSSSGILIAGWMLNSVTFNTIQKCNYGIHLTFTIANTVKRNNFINNDLPAGFYTAYLTRWDKNYWGRPRFVPKAIEGDLLLWEHYEPWGGGWEIEIPWLNIDFRPAKIPIIIP